MTSELEPRFSLQIARFSDFTALLAGEGGVELEDEALRESILQSGRALLQARAGAGKTVTLRRIVDGVQGSRRVVDLPQVEPSLLATEFAAEQWLKDVVDRLARPLTVGLDGLDSIPPTSAQWVLSAVESLTSLDPNCTVVVCDRLGRRPIREERWALLGLSQIAPGVLGRLAPGVTFPGWAISPLYLNLALSTSSPSLERFSGPSALFRELLADSLGGDSELDRVATAHLETQTIQPRRANLGFLSAIAAGEDAVARLVASGLAEAPSEGWARLRHQLIGDYLLAHAVAREKALWCRDAFEVLTVEGATFEPLGMLLEQVDPQSVDDLVRKVDDWNFYAAAHLLVEDRKTERRVSRPLRDALLLLLGRRRLSQLPSTRRQVEDALILHGGHLATDILSTLNEAELSNLVQRLPNYDAEWWDEWRSIFTLAPPSEPNDEQVEALGSADGLLGWTAANVLATLAPSSSQMERIRDLASSAEEPAVRWRAVHVIGGQRDSRAADVCLAIFRNDSSNWVRYGALRAFVAILARLEDPGERASRFLRLADDSRAIVENPRWKREIERSVAIDDPPDDWPASVGLLIEKLWAESGSVEEQDRWRRLSAQIRIGWSGGWWS